MKNLSGGEAASMSKSPPRGLTLPPEGAICAEIPTPFTADGSLDEQALAAVAASQAQLADALIVTSEFGEVLSLSKEERQRVAEISIEAAALTPVIVQVTAFSTVETLDLARHAEQAGAAAIAAGRPYYWHLSDQAMSDYFVAIAGAVDRPLLAVSRAEAPIAPALLSRLAAREANLAGVIELGTSAIVPLEIRRLTEHHGRRFLTMLDAMTAAPASYTTPCSFIFHLNSIAPELVRRAAGAASARNVEMTRAVMGQLLALHRVFGRDPGRVKYAMQRVGLPAGATRPPLLPPDAAGRQAIDEELSRQGLA